MEVIKDEGLLVAELITTNFQERNRFTSTNYSSHVAFDCGCGERHTVNDPTLELILIALPVKFLFECRNKYIAFVHVKGFFKQKANCLWSCKAKLYHKVIKDLKENKNL